jgi:hypothetical protein
MRLPFAFLTIPLLGCVDGTIASKRNTPESPSTQEINVESVMTLRECVDLLIQDPKQAQQRPLLAVLLGKSDDEVMATMRAHHGTGKNAMVHYYPSHLYIHPFLLGSRLLGGGDRSGAEAAFEAAFIAASQKLTYQGNAAVAQDWSLHLAGVVAEQSRLRLEEIRASR